MSDADSPARERATITDFMTDGALAALCASASRLTGAQVELRDAQGRVVVAAPEDSPPWRVLEQRADGASAARDGREAAIAALPRVRTIFTAPITIGTERIGGLALTALAAAVDAPAQQAEIERFLSLLASTVGEICAQQAALSAKVSELKALHRLSSLLVSEPGVDAILAAALGLAVETVGVDAGSIRVLDDERQILQLRSSIGLSDAYIHEAGALPAKPILDALRNADAPIEARDLSRQPDIVHPGAIARERLRSAITAPMRIHGSVIGVVRLYMRAPRRFTPAERSLLRAIAEQTAAAVENARLAEAETRNRHVDRQLHLAGQVQSRMLPPVNVWVDRPGPLDFAWRWEPSLELGGDFLDVFEATGGVGLALGDVVGKGVPAALLMASVRAALRAHVRDDLRLEETVARTNQALCRDTLINEFSTLFFGVIDPATLRLSYCNAGHEPALIVRVPAHRAPSRADVDELRTGGMALGVDPSQRYQQGECPLREGDALVVFSDGLSEALDFAGKRFTRQRVVDAILALLADEPAARARRIADHLLWEMRRYVGLNRQSDDTTILVVRARRG